MIGDHAAPAPEATIMEYIVKTGPADTLDELMPRLAPELR